MELLTDNLNVIDVLNMMIRKWWLIVITMIIFGSATYIYTDLFVEPLYKTDGTLYVNCDTEASQLDVTSVGRLDSNYRLASTYIEILKRRTFLTEVARDLNNKYSYSEISKMLDIESVNETELLEITVTGENPQDICSILDSILNRAEDQLLAIVRGGSVEIVDRPYVPTAPFSPNKSRNTMIGLIVGAVLAAGVIFLMNLFDTHIKTADELRRRYDEPVLGEIPSLSAE